MRVLLLGSGAKDNAIAWWFSKSNYLSDLYCAPGNPALDGYATSLPDVSPSSPEQVYEACLKYNINFVFIGTEAPLLTGVVNYLNARGIETFGCPSESLKLEADRNFARAFTDRHNIPTPRRNLFESADALSKFLSRHNGERFVLKSNSISPSRTMLDSADTDALLSFSDSLFKIGPVLLEEHKKGLPITATLLLDNSGYFALPFTSDYMYTSEKNGLSTGGMGSICPICMNEEVSRAISELIIEPTIYGMKVEQLSYKGVLTISIIVGEDDVPVVVDYHVRFNDPATQAIVPIIKNDLVDLLLSMRENRVSAEQLRLTGDSSVAVIIASENYPSEPKTGIKVTGLNPLVLYNSLPGLPLVFTGAVNADFVTTGGRNFTVVGIGDNIKAANENAYHYIDQIKFEGSWYREDIGNKFFIREKEKSDA